MYSLNAYSFHKACMTLKNLTKLKRYSFESLEANLLNLLNFYKNKTFNNFVIVVL